MDGYSLLWYIECGGGTWAEANVYAKVTKNTMLACNVALKKCYTDRAQERKGKASKARHHHQLLCSSAHCSWGNSCLPSDETINGVVFSNDYGLPAVLLLEHFVRLTPLMMMLTDRMYVHVVKDFLVLCCRHVKYPLEGTKRSTNAATLVFISKIVRNHVKI